MGSNLAGIIFANLYEEMIPELTSRRTIASVPFGGKYRLVDFPLSNMSNSGVNNVALISKDQFHSLLDHIGSGSAWDLSKRRSGLTLLSPYGGHSFENRIEAMYHLHGYIEHLDEEYIILANCSNVANIDYQKMFEYHLQKDADITLLYKEMNIPNKIDAPLVLGELIDGRVTEMFINPQVKDTCKYVTGSIIIKRDLLMELVRECMSLNKLNFKKNILQDNVSRLRIYGYKFDGHVSIISSLYDYYKESMLLMDSAVRAELFQPLRPIYTKVRDDAPSRYGLTSKVKGSLVAQGCIIDGEVENSIISKGVYIGKGAKVTNSIIMQDTKIAEGAVLDYVIVDKDVIIGENRTLSGYETYPVYIAKQSVI